MGWYELAREILIISRAVTQITAIVNAMKNDKGIYCITIFASSCCFAPTTFD